jgi:hypothetical protein
MTSGDDTERDEFMRTLNEISHDVGWQLEDMIGHELFQAMIEMYGQEQCRHWLLLDALKTARDVDWYARVRAIETELQDWRREAKDGRRPPPSAEDEHALEAKYGLATDGPGDDSWLWPGALQRLVEYFASALLRT